MIKSAYRKNDSGIFRPVKRIVLTAAAIASIAYFGGRTNFDQTFDKILNGERQIAANYAAVELDHRTNQEGKTEFYIVYEKEGKKAELPILTGAKGPQTGSIEYALQNIDYNKLSQDEALEHAKKILGQAEPNQRIEYLLSEFGSATKSQAYEYMKTAWNKLDPEQKHAIVRSELEKLLR